MKKDYIIGIDLGSYFSSVSCTEAGHTIVIPNSEGSMSTPSVVSFDKETSEIKVGEPARRQSALNPENTIFNIKRLIGRTYDEVKHLKRPYKIVNNNGKAGVDVNGKIYSPEEISAIILQKMKKTAEDYLGQEVNRAVITVPAYFNSDERAATRTAGEIAGFKVERIISEPTAASLNIKEKKGRLYMIIDSGGCTSDISIIDIEDGLYETISTDGNLDLGGNLIDDAIVNWLADDFKSEFNSDLRKDPMALQRLMEASEKAKIELSTTTQTEINLPYITAIDGIPKHLVKTLNKSKLEQMIQFYSDELIKLIKSTLKKGNKKISDIDTIVCVGGTTRVPYLIEIVEKFFGKKVDKSLNPDLAISTGAGLQASVIAGDNNEILLLDVTALNFYIETLGGVATCMIESNTTIPISKSQTFSTAVDNQSSVQINIATGERPIFKDNKFLGTFNLDGIMPAMRGVPQLEVEFNIDVNSILTVKAKDKTTGKENKIRIEGSSALTKEEIEKMKTDAKLNEENDKKEKEKIEKLNQADTLIFQTEKQIKEFDEKLTEEDKTSLQKIVDKLKESHKSQNIDEIDTYTKELTESWNSISERLYKNTETSQQEPQNEPVEDIEDIEFEEVKGK